MSIINSFDNKSKSLFVVDAFYKKIDLNVTTCIVFFSRHVLEMLLNKYECKKVSNVSTSNGPIDIYLFEVENRQLLFYMSPIGSCIATSIMHEVAYITGAKNFVLYGSCGVLDNSKCSGKLIIPTASYRDEGLSYHYMKASDYIEIKNANKIAKIFDKYNYPYVMGKTWTTDAIYMETENKAKARIADGCISVEMESSGLQAICNYYGYEFYTFFFPADLLDGSSWNKGKLASKEEYDIQKQTFDIALKVALNI